LKHEVGATMTEASQNRPISVAALLDSRLGLFAARAVLVLLFFCLWQFASGRFISKFWVSDPTSVFGKLVDWSSDGSLWRHLQTTLTTMFLGYGLGSVLGIIIGFVLGLSPAAERIVSPYLSALYGLPKIALAPLFVILLGIGIESKVALVALVVVFLILYTTLEGGRNVDPDYIQFMKLMGATWWEILRKVLFPSSLAWIYSGLRLAVSYAFTTTVVGEVLSSNRGLGYLITSSAARFDAAGVFAAVTVLVILSVIFTQALTRLEARGQRSHAS
jgi:NitT/TauT family transport system permease protein